MRKQLCIFILGGITSAMSLTASAATPSFDFAQGSYINFDGPGSSIDGFSAAIEKKLKHGFFLEGMGVRVSEDSINNTFLRGGGGYSHNLVQMPSVALYGVFGFTREEVTGVSDINHSETGQYAIVGVRSSVSPEVELSLSAERYWWDDFNSTEFVAAGRFYVNQHISLRAAYRFEDSDYSAYEIGVAYHF